MNSRGGSAQRVARSSPTRQPRGVPPPMLDNRVRMLTYIPPKTSLGHKHLYLYSFALIHTDCEPVQEEEVSVVMAKEDNVAKGEADEVGVDGEVGLEKAQEGVVLKLGGGWLRLVFVAVEAVVAVVEATPKGGFFDAVVRSGDFQRPNDPQCFMLALKTASFSSMTL